MNSNLHPTTGRTEAFYTALVADFKADLAKLDPTSKQAALTRRMIRKNVLKVFEFTNEPTAEWIHAMLAEQAEELAALEDHICALKRNTRISVAGLHELQRCESDAKSTRDYIASLERDLKHYA